MKVPRDSQTTPNEKDVALAAEKALLGASLRAYDAFYAALGTGLNSERFYIAQHGILWRHIQAVTQQGMEISVHTVAASLEESGELANAGGFDYLESLYNHGSALDECESNVLYYAGQILGAASHRIRADYAIRMLTAVNAGDVTRFDQLQAEMQQKLQAMQPATETASTYFLTDDEMEHLPPARQLLGNILYYDSVAILYSPSGRWKSLVALIMVKC